MTFIQKFINGEVSVEDIHQYKAQWNESIGTTIYDHLRMTLDDYNKWIIYGDNHLLRTFKRL